MPRNSSGTCTLAEAPFTPNTSISSSATNNNNTDIVNMLTGSLARDGSGGMTAELSLAVDGFSYAADPDTGMSRSAANTQVISVGGLDWTFTGSDLTAPSGTSLLPLIGEIRMWAFAAAPTGWVLMQGQACTTTYPRWRAALIGAGNPYGTSGGDPLFPNFQCAIPAGQDAGRGGLNGSGTLGAFLGLQTATLLPSNLPPYTPAGTNNKPPITAAINQSAGTQVYVPAGGGGEQVSGGTTVNRATLTATASLDSAPVFTGTAQGGTSTPFSIVQPTLVINFIGRAA